MIPVAELTKRMQKLALVEVVCVDHFDNPDRHCKTVNIHGPGHKHQCHLCNGPYWLMKASTPKEKQICSNCKGPVRPSGEESCWPDLLIVDNFVDPADQRPTWVQRKEVKSDDSGHGAELQDAQSDGEGSGGSRE